MSLHPLKDVVSRQVARIVINDITFMHILYRLAEKKSAFTRAGRQTDGTGA